MAYLWVEIPGQALAEMILIDLTKNILTSTYY